jgi:hypothetical protein
VLVGSLALSLRAAHRLSVRAYPDGRAAARALAPVAALAVLLTIAGIVLLHQPMGMRHVM